MDFAKKMSKLDDELEKVCKELNLSKKEILQIKTELSRRIVNNSFRGMPPNLLLSIHMKNIEHLRDYGKLN